MKLILIFGIWMNVSGVTYLADTDHIPFGKADYYCLVKFQEHRSAIIENKSCDEVAVEINKHLGE